VLAVMAAKTSRPIFVPGILRVDLPTGFHVREEIVRVNLLNDVDRRPDRGSFG
jgi:hypothetical protein